MTEQVKQQAQQAAQTAVDQTQQVAGQAVDQAKSVLDSRKDDGAQTLQQTADALRQTGDTLRQNNVGFAAGFVDGAAGQIDRAAEYLRTTNVNDMVSDVENFARQNGTVFFGGAFVLGLFAARFLKSSTPPPQYGRGGSNTGGYSAYGGTSYGNAGYGSNYGGQSNTARYGGGPYDYSGGQAGGAQYSYTDTAGSREDVSGTPYVARNYAPGMAAGETTGTDTFATGATTDQDVM